MASLETRRIGELDCHLITTKEPPRLVAIFCHGFGAPGDDLVPVGAQILQSCPELLDQVQIIFPAAPLALADFGGPFGRAWWPLDMEKLTQAIEIGELRDLRNEAPPQLPDARNALLGLIAEVTETTGLRPGRIVLGGFSQGAMLATDVTLHLQEPPAGLVIWSGSLLNEKEWQSRSAALKDLPVVISHGHEDPILPFEGAKLLRTFCSTAGADVQFLPFVGPHTLTMQAIEAAGQLCLRALKSEHEESA